MAAKSLVRMADAAAKRHGVPPALFRRLIQQESGWNPDATNPSGATGLVQIHLPSHPDISEQQARDPAFALAWGARYLAAQKARFGRWDLALAAYNAGPGNVENGRWQSFPETRDYVRNIMRGGKSARVPVGRAATPVSEPGRSQAPTGGVGGGPLPGLLAQAFQSNNQLLGVDTPEPVLSLLSQLAAPSPAPAPPRPPAGAQVPQETLRPTGGLGGLAELFYDPKGAYNSGQFIKPIGGHSDHLHASITNPQQMLWLIDYAKKRGYNVRENPYVDPVDPVHTQGSFHYRPFKGRYNGRELGQGVDISGGDLGRLFEDILSRFGVRR